MAYCVHCGVKLGPGEKACPLCHTVSVDPSETSPPSSERNYPTHTPEQLLTRSKRYFLSLFGILLLVPALLCLVIDLLGGNGVTWSVYAFTALVLLYITIAVPIWVEKHKPYFALITAYGCLMLYLKMVEEASRSGNWFFPIVLPCVTLFTLLTLLIIRLYRHGKLGRFTLCGAVLLEIGILSLLIDILIAVSLGRIALLWSPYVLAPCLFVAALIFFINGNHTIREEIRRRVHF